MKMCCFSMVDNEAFWNPLITCLDYCYNCYCIKRVFKKKKMIDVRLLVIGLDNAGKSTIVDYLFNKKNLKKDNVVPTIGFRTVSFNYKEYSVKLYDVGGGPQIRALWPKYYNDVHGIIYVVDSSDIERIYESTDVFRDVVCHDLNSHKPILVLASKQDVDLAVDEANLIEVMNIETVVNFNRCFTRVEICSVFPDPEIHNDLRLGIDEGFEWLLSIIETYYVPLNELLEANRMGVPDDVRRSFTSLQSWTAKKEESPEEWWENQPALDLQGAGVTLAEGEHYKLSPTPQKRSCFGRMFKANNKTSPLVHEPVITQENMKQMIQKITLEDLVESSKLASTLAPCDLRDRIRPKERRPKSAPATAKQWKPRVEVAVIDATPVATPRA